MKTRLILGALTSLAIAVGGAHARAASPSPSPSPTPTPNPYRSLNFASETLGESGGPIALVGGFAAARRDGTAAIVCVSFKNTGPLTARRVVFDFALVGQHGRDLGALHLDRHGEFSPGIDIYGWSSLAAWQSGVGHRGYGDNCTHWQQGIAAAPILRAASVTYRVTRVEYGDGTSWPQ